MSRGATVGDLWAAFRRSPLRASATFVVVAGVGIAWAILAPDVYRSEAKLLLRLGRETVGIDATTSLGPTLPVTQARDSQVRTDVETLRSLPIAEHVVDTLGPQPVLDALARPRSATLPVRALRAVGLASSVDLDERERAILAFREHFAVETVRDTNNIVLWFEARRRDFPQRALAAVIERFLELHVALHASSGSYELLEQQVGSQREALGTAEAELLRFLDASDGTTIAARRDQLVARLDLQRGELARRSAELASSTATLARLRERFDGLQSEVVVSQTTGIPNQARSLMRDKLFDLQIELGEARKKFPDGYPIVVDLEERVAAAERLVAAETSEHTQRTAGINATRQELEATIIREEARAAGLEAEVAARRADVEALETERAELETRANAAAIGKSRREREIDLLSRTLEKFADAFAQARVERDLAAGRVSNVRVVQEPSRPLGPVRPNRLTIALLSLVLGAIAAAVVVILASGARVPSRA